MLLSFIGGMEWEKKIMIRDLTFSYGGNGNQLEHISLDIAAGEVIVMTGPIREREKLFDESD